MIARKLFSFVFILVCFFPAGWRLYSHGLTEPVGLVSDLSVGLLFAAIAWQGSRLLRFLPIILWCLFHIMSQELSAAVQRMPSWQDLVFMTDPNFLKNSAAGFHFTHPEFAIGLAILSLAAILLPLHRPDKKLLIIILGTGLLLLPLHTMMVKAIGRQSVAARYNPLHWFISDLYKTALGQKTDTLSLEELPLNLRTADMSGTRFFQQGQAKNVLLVVLEGVSGLYLPALAREIQTPEQAFQMERLGDGTADAMLVPSFITHSHQTIRGLYAIHCGDFSKFSYTLPKALELEFNPERARQCLPAQLAAQGFETHFLQGAPLQFMNKDRAMPTMGFQQVHGVEWFTQRTRTDFDWGTIDEDFFRGASQYVRNLKANGKPWFLSLLTVATHQPFDATDELIARYGSRKIAALALLDQAVGRFIEDLRQDRILENTLVIITSDESQGAEGADWVSSWGFAAVFAPEQKALPRFKQGTYGLVDLEVSILDYLGLPLPPAIIGRSLFQDYDNSRDMISYTASKLRWQTPDNILYECTRDYDCRMRRDAGILGPHPATEPAEEGTGKRLFAMAAALDNKLANNDPKMVLNFTHGETRPLPEKVRNEWVDNLIGAQYLSFPENSQVHVDIQLQVIKAGPEGIQPLLNLRMFEIEVDSIAYPPFPRLKEGESHRLQFDFKNIKARNAFSFHLTAEGKNAAIRFEKFQVVILRDK